ncbi:MAG: hypothetical protein GY851_20680 [bacterium]|nr:hypothetical protein [bacterium]
MSLFDTFVDPPREYTLIPFWFLNDDLNEDELKRQIDDFADHGVYGFVPHARMGLADRIPFMSDAWLHYTKVCVDHAAKKDMFVILYDEGMYPSGSCAGQVVAANPRYATRCLQQRPKSEPLGDDEYLVAEDDAHLYVNRRSNGHIRGVHFGTDDGEPGAPPSGDLLNPESVACFFRLVLDGHYNALKEHFGKTITAVFTDEPDMLGRGHLRGVREWTWGLETWLEDYLGYDMRPHLGALWDGRHPDNDRYARDWKRAINARLEETYYAPYSKWCADHGVSLTGHPAQPGDIGTLKYFHVPGQDIVWRYIEPFHINSLEGPQSTMAKCSSSAQRHYGRKRNLNECYGAYGWEFTEDEMWWIANWLLVRGVNLLSPHAFYYSIEGPRRDERPPDVGPNNVWWDRYKPFADYCRRLSWLMSGETQVCSFAVLGTATRLPWKAARVLFESQRDFNYLDVDTLVAKGQVSEDGIRVGDMHYAALIVDGAGYLDETSKALLQPMLDAGRVIAYGKALPDVPATAAPDGRALVRILDAIARPDVVVKPATPDLRFIHLRHGETDVYLFCNEGEEVIEGRLKVAAKGGKREWWDPEAACVIEDAAPNRISVPPYRTRVLACS